MEEGNLAILVDAKTEYTKQLINILKNNIYHGIKKLYRNAKDSCEEENNILSNFQLLLSDIPKWNQEIINGEYLRIISESKCDWLEELITAVFVSHTRILTSINFSKNKKKINLKIPKVDHFIHQCYIDIARSFWKNPYLFDETLSNFDYQRNRREAENIIENSIGETIRKQLPVKHILKEYLGSEYSDDEQDDIEEDISSKYRNNLRKMVQAEIENVSKEKNVNFNLENETCSIDNSPSENISTELQESLKDDSNVTLNEESNETPVEESNTPTVEENYSTLLEENYSTLLEENNSTLLE